MYTEEKGFIHKRHLACGIIGCVITVINMILLTLMKNGILRIEYHLFFWVILPNAVAKILLCVWLLHYGTTVNYKKDINIFARDIFIVIIANILVIAFDESTILYYLAQSIPCAMIYIFMCIMITRLRDALRTKRDSNRVFILNIFLYILIILQVFIMAISFSNYDPYLVAFVGFSYLCAAVGMIEINRMEKIARLTIQEDSGLGESEDEDVSEDEYDIDEEDEDFY